MGGQGNVRLKGSVRTTDAAAFVQTSNNGMFQGVALQPLGVYEYTVDPEWSIAPADVIVVQVESIGFTGLVDRISETRFDVHIRDIGEDEWSNEPHSVRVTQVNRG